MKKIIKACGISAADVILTISECIGQSRRISPEFYWIFSGQTEAQIGVRYATWVGIPDVIQLLEVFPVIRRGH